VTLDPKLLAGHMAFVMLVGAANADSDSYQRARLREEFLPLLKNTKHWDAHQLTRKLQDIMGERWAPSGEWMAQIDALLPPKETK